MKRGVLVAIVLIITMLLGCSTKAPVSLPPTQETTPIIDAHAHIAGGSPEEMASYIDELVVEMDKLGVVKATLEGLRTKRTPKDDQDILVAYDRHPNRFYPYLSGFNPQDEGAIDYVRKQLETGKWRGLGEIYLRHSPGGVLNPADHPVMLEIYDLCAEYEVPIHIHFESDYGIDYELGIKEIKRALAHNPNTIFIWAHGCHGNIHLMDEFPNLYTTVEIYSGGELFNKAWTDRLMIGSDVGLPGVIICGGGSYAEKMGELRQLLSSFDQATMENVAYKNIAKLMKDESVLHTMRLTFLCLRSLPLGKFGRAPHPSYMTYDAGAEPLF